MEHFEIHNVIKENMDYKNKYYWTFKIETSRFGGVMGPSCDYVTDENLEAIIDC